MGRLHQPRCRQENVPRSLPVHACPSRSEGGTTRRSHMWTHCARRVKLKGFHKFEDTAEAVQSATALVEGKLSAGMKKFLKKTIVSKELKARQHPPAHVWVAAHHLPIC